jgi:hypothetical protein
MRLRRDAQPGWANNNNISKLPHLSAAWRRIQQQGD